MARRRIAGVLVAGLVLAAAVASPTRAALLWTLTASPSSVTTGVPTAFSLRASLALLGEIRCLEVDLPASFTIHGVAVVGSNAGSSWSARRTGNTVRVLATSGGDRLRSIGHYVDFRIDATAGSPGSWAWAARSYADEDCDGSSSLLGVPPVVLVIGEAVTPTEPPLLSPTQRPTPTPTPTPTAAPTRTPSPTRSPSPAPSPVRPSPDPSGNGAPRPTDAEGRDIGGSATSPTPPASPTPSSGGGSVGSDRAAGVAGRAGSTRAPVATNPEPDAETVPVSLALGRLGMFRAPDVWIVLGLFGGPGLIIVGFVLLQAAGALVWMPAIRRLRGDDADVRVAT